MSYVLGIDLGTSSLKGLLVDVKGNVVASATVNYPLITRQTGFSEQDPLEWLRATEVVIEKLLEICPDMKVKLEGISFSGQMHSLVILDEEGQILHNAILWNDVRTTKQCKEIMDKAGKQILAITKNIALEGFTLPKILWLQDNEPEIWSKAKHLLLPKDYLGWWMTGAYQMDYSDAAGTLLFDIEGKVWSKEVLKTFAIPTEIMPELIASTELRGFLTVELSKKFGFTQAVKIFGGGADNACAALAAGIVSADIGLSSIGTSGVFLSYENSGNKDYQGKLHLFNHVAQNSYYSINVRNLRNTRPFISRKTEKSQVKNS
jgi:Sugar (pentulose and hexulose) kinases